MDTVISLDVLRSIYIWERFWWSLHEI